MSTAQMKRLSKGSGYIQDHRISQHGLLLENGTVAKNTSGIEHLIEREYLERDKNQALCFHKNLQRVLSSLRWP